MWWSVWGAEWLRPSEPPVRTLAPLSRAHILPDPPAYQGCLSSTSEPGTINYHRFWHPGSLSFWPKPSPRHDVGHRLATNPAPVSTHHHSRFLSAAFAFALGDDLHLRVAQVAPKVEEGTAGRGRATRVEGGTGRPRQTGWSVIFIFGVHVLPFSVSGRVDWRHRMG